MRFVGSVNTHTAWANTSSRIEPAAGCRLPWSIDNESRRIFLARDSGCLRKSFQTILDSSKVPDRRTGCVPNLFQIQNALVPNKIWNEGPDPRSKFQTIPNHNNPPPPYPSTITHHHRRCQHGTRRWLSTIGPIAHLSAPALHDLCICMGLSSILFKLLSAAGGGGAHRRRRRLPPIPDTKPSTITVAIDNRQCHRHQHYVYVSLWGASRRCFCRRRRSREGEKQRERGDERCDERDRGKHSEQCTISEGRETSHGHYILSVDPISYTSH